MSELTWLNPEGSLGKYVSYTKLALQFYVDSDNLSSIISYKLLSGELPQGIATDPVYINEFGLLTGTLEDIVNESSYNFTVRATDQFGSIKDRTFSLTVAASALPLFTTPPGSLMNILDCTFVNKKIEYSNPNSDNIVTVSLSSGTLPPGLYVRPDGVIAGYAKPPLAGISTPITKTYNFTLRLDSILGSDTRQYSITIRNQNLTIPPNSRTPAIFNISPSYFPISMTDPYNSFYTPNGTLPTIRANEYFTFKIIGHDFENAPLTYYFNNLPPGLSGNSSTGWITGKVNTGSIGIFNYEFTVFVAKRAKPTIRSLKATFRVTVTNNVVQDIVWKTDSSLGTIVSGAVSNYKLEATSSKTLNYRILNGNLPNNLKLLDTGEIVGKVAFEPLTRLLDNNVETKFTFTVEAYSTIYPLLKSQRTFELSTLQYFSDPVENVYLKASPSLSGKTILKNLLNDDTVIPASSLYRANDVNFGKATNITMLHSYGLKSSSLSQYINAIQKNHYTRNIILGKIKTAVARDENNNIEYEVVYADIIDDLVNKDNTSIPLSIKYPIYINLNKGDWTVNVPGIYASYSEVNSIDYYASLSPGFLKILYPASLPNMRNRLVEEISQIVDKALLPKWMTSQQEDGNVLGFVQAWVICYTLPGKSKAIAENISKNYSLNMIDFTVDRLFVDKSNTYNYNTNLQIPAWTSLPSATPYPDPTDEKDLVVLFPRENILPK